MENVAKTWNDASKRWLDGRKDKKPAHLKQEKHYVEVLTTTVADGVKLDNLPLSKITKGVVASLRDELLKTRSVATVNRYLSVLRAGLNMARDEWECVDTVPKIKRMEEPKRVRFIEKEDVRRLLKELPNHLKDKVVFALATGLRKGNILGLRWQNIDLEHRQLWVHPDDSKAGKAIGIHAPYPAFQFNADIVPGRYLGRVFIPPRADIGIWPIDDGQSRHAIKIASQGIAA